MHFIELIAYILVSVVFLLLVCFRITVTTKTALKFLMTGALLGAAFVIPLQKFIDPYNTLLIPGNSVPPDQRPGFWLHVSVSILTLVVLLWPLRKLIFNENLCQVQSVSDIFLLSFLTGMGFDLLGLFTAHVSRDGVLDSFTWIPPFQQDLSDHHYIIAGMGYRIGLLALTAFLSVKYLRNKWIGIILVIAEGAVFSYEVAAIKLHGPNTPLPAGFSLLLATRVIVWLPVLLTLAFNLREWQNALRLKKSKAPDDPSSPVLQSTTGWNLKQFLQKLRLARLQRQNQLVELAIIKNGNNAVLHEIGNRIREALNESLSGKQPAPRQTEYTPVNVPLLAAFAVLAVLLLPAGTNYFICVALGIYIVKKYLQTTQRPAPFREVNHIISAISDKSIALIAVAAAFLGVMGAIENYFYPASGAPFTLYAPFAPTFSEWTNEMFNYVKPNVKVSPVYPDAFAVILAAATAGLISRESWVNVPARKPRPLWKNYQLVRIAMIFLVLFICNRIYVNGLNFLHKEYGEVFYYVASQPESAAAKPANLPSWLEGVHLEKDAPFGNNLGAWIMGIITLLAGVLLFILLGKFDKKFKQLTT